MAKKSRFISPVKQTGLATDKNAELPASSDPEEQQPTMGNEQSRALNEAQDRTTTRPSTGQLKKPTKKIALAQKNPAYRNPLLTAGGTRQRTLGGGKKSVYEFPDAEEEVRLVPKTRGGLYPLTGFSPLKGVRSRAEGAKAVGKAGPVTRSSPRKSKRTERVDESEEGEGEGEESETAEEQEDREQEGEVEETVHAEDGSNVEGQGKNDEEGENEEDEYVQVASPKAGAAHEKGTSSAKRTSTRGKRAKTPEAPAVAPPAAKKKRGRPSKNKHTEEVEPSDTVASKKRGRANEDRTAVAEHTPKRTRRQTRAEDDAERDEQVDREGDDGEEQSLFQSMRKRRQEPWNRTREAEDDAVEEEQAVDAPRQGRQMTGQQQAAKGAVEAVAQEYDNEDESNTEERQPSPSKTNKRPHSSTNAKANTSSKRRRPDTAPEEPEPSAEGHATQSRSGLTEADKHRIFGRWPELKRAFNAADHIGRPVEGRGVTRVRYDKVPLELEDKQVRAAVKLCKKLTTSYNTSRDNTGESSTPAVDPASVLSELRQRIDGLCGKNEEYDYDGRNVDRCTSMYYHLVPKLLGLVESAVTCYEKLDEREFPANELTIPHLHVVNRIINLLLDLVMGAAEYHPRPETSYHVVQPVREIAPILRDVHRSFHDRIQHHQHRLATQRQAQIDAQQRAADLEQEQRRAVQQQEFDRMQAKWIRLHEVRYWAEGGFPPHQKVVHLERPVYDVDPDGQRFYSALLDGLREYAGEFVFERLFAECCRKGRELNRFNVTEIVTQAAVMREWLIKCDQKRGRETEAWVLGIPVWTSGHPSLAGKENEEDAGEAEAVEGEASTRRSGRQGEMITLDD
ncbi:uncharacterized protein LTR77_007552 [Saxophila tyrrhenica]|uniref:Uncharacterized protein n=1 Tax=Saxophila tyrrhenica TaxID=1690608 RepID=A0AAV9P6F3_9PEZI|nr:hypothetical protein LTR77_007552 [Saxophila tyrrhenica]